jgi:apolipoprotein N-acyltransferase
MTEIATKGGSIPSDAVALPVAMALAAAGAALFAAAFPPYDIGGTAFVALTPLLLALRGAGRARAFFLGWLFATLGCTASVGSSVYEAASRYFESSTALRLLFAFLVPQLYAAPYIGLFACFVRRFVQPGGAPSAVALVVPAAWTASEFARASIGHGAPWLLLAHAQHARLWMLQIADLSGAFGVSFVVAACNAAAFLLLRELRRGGAPRRAAAPLLLAAALLAATYAYGVVRIDEWREAAVRLRLALVQGDVPLAWRSNPRHLADALQRMRDLTAPLLEQQPDLVIWPENAVGFAVAANRDLLGGLTAGLAPGARLLLGAPRTVAAADGHRSEYRNTAFLLDPAGHIEASYDKRRLTPFAEYAPWPVAHLARRRYGRAQRYHPGDEWSLFAVQGEPFATLLCYEAIYPDLAREFVRRGARFLVNISNDDWFGDRPALAQHLNAAILRSIENRRALARATNTGITAVIDPTGAVIARAPAGSPQTLTAAIPVVATQTFFTRWGDLFAWLCVAACLLALGSSRLVGARQ